MGRIRILAVALVLVAALASSVVGWSAVSWWAVPALIVLTLAGEKSRARVVVGRQGVTIGLVDVFVACALFMQPGVWITIAGVVGVTLAYVRKLDRLKLIFNAAQFSCSVSLGLLVIHMVGDSVVGIGLGLLTLAVVNWLAVGTVVSIASKQRFVRVVADTGFVGATQIAGNLSIGLLAGWLLQNAPIGLLGLVSPLAMSWWSYWQQSERTAEARLFAELAHGRERLSTPSPDVSARVIVQAVARLFGGAEVHLLLRGVDGVYHYVGDESGSISRNSADATSFGDQWVQQAIGARSVSIGVDSQGRPFCSGLMGNPDTPHAVLMARRANGSAGFNALDSKLAQVLVAQAESWLSVADSAVRREDTTGRLDAYVNAARALGDLGARTVPSLLSLGESAQRLTRLVIAPEGRDPIGEIVNELHAAERAVASLLGAVALASDPDLVAAGASQSKPPTALRDADEWTTTGSSEETSLEVDLPEHVAKRLSASEHRLSVVGADATSSKR